jgi:hypothetical protein
LNNPLILMALVALTADSAVRSIIGELLSRSIPATWLV